MIPPVPSRTTSKKELTETLNNFLLAHKADPWQDLERHRGSVADARHRFREQASGGG